MLQKDFGSAFQQICAQKLVLLIQYDGEIQNRVGVAVTILSHTYDIVIATPTDHMHLAYHCALVRVLVVSSFKVTCVLSTDMYVTDIQT